MPDVPLVINVLLLLFASTVLIKVIQLFISSSSAIARRFGISGYTISFLLIAIATSLPEVVVGVASALDKNPGLSFGNAIGSNIALLTLVIAIPVLFATSKGLSTRTILHSQDAYYSLFFSLLPIAFFVDGKLSQVDGALLIVAYTVYAFLVWRRSKGVEKLIEQIGQENMWKHGTIFVVSLLFLLGASELIVMSAKQISAHLGWGLTFVGLTITAIGTSLPEIVFTVGAARGRLQQEILGDVVGSVVANSTVVLGITALIYPIEVVNGGIGFSAIMLSVFVMLVFLRFVRTKEKIDKKEALILLLMYITFIVAEYVLGTGV